MDFIEKLKAALQGELPGWSAQSRMINYERPQPTQPHLFHKDTRIGAVLILLYYQENKLYTLLMQRPKYNGVHSAQVSFPGGRMESMDASPAATALREAQEETGIDPALVEILGKLTDVYIPPSRFLVKPFVAFTPRRPVLKPDQREVDVLIEAPVFDLIDDNNVGRSNIFVHSLKANVEAYYYGIQGYMIWGATAMMISEFKELLRTHSLLKRPE